MTYTVYDDADAYEASRILWTWLESTTFKEAADFRMWLFDAFRADSYDDVVAWKNLYWVKSVSSNGKTGTDWGAFSIESPERAVVAEDFSTYLTRDVGPFGRNRGSGVVCTTLVIDGGREDIVYKELWKMARRGVFSNDAPIYGMIVHVDMRGRDIPSAHVHIVHATRYGIFNMQKLFAGERALVNDVLGTFKRGSFKDREKFKEEPIDVSKGDAKTMAAQARCAEEVMLG